PVYGDEQNQWRLFHREIYQINSRFFGPYISPYISWKFCGRSLYPTRVWRKLISCVYKTF
uniref:Uncharacterized protein n=1 Tax=Oryza brachyantha TaxID=4533 RepID=J3M510_ORYBR